MLSIAQFANGGWFCGGAWLEDDSTCVCGDKNITKPPERDSNTADCCGRDTCYVKQNGDGACPDGQWCRAGSTFRCGDIRIPNTGYCQCGEEKLKLADYNGSLLVSQNFPHLSENNTTEIFLTNILMASTRWCCPSSSSSCSYKDGIGICINGTVNTGNETSCFGGVTYNGNNKNYRDNFYCEDGQKEDRRQFCLGTPPI